MRQGAFHCNSNELYTTSAFGPFGKADLHAYSPFQFLAFHITVSHAVATSAPLRGFFAAGLAEM